MGNSPVESSDSARTASVDDATLSCLDAETRRAGVGATRDEEEERWDGVARERPPNVFCAQRQSSNLLMKLDGGAPRTDLCENGLMETKPTPIYRFNWPIADTNVAPVYAMTRFRNEENENVHGTRRAYRQGHGCLCLKSVSHVSLCLSQTLRSSSYLSHRNSRVWLSV